MTNRPAAEVRDRRRAHPKKTMSDEANHPQTPSAEERKAAKAARLAARAEQSAADASASPKPPAGPADAPESKVSRKDISKRLAALIADVGQLPKSDQSTTALRKLECAATALGRYK